MADIKERPILFSGPMVRAILDGRKTQTRRVIKPQPGLYIDELHGNALRERAPYTLECYETGNIIGSGFQDEDRVYRCPFGVPGDRLWVRETWAEKAWTDDQCQKMGCPNAPTHPSEIYLETPLRAIHRASCSVAYGDPGPWRPSIHMPRWASRITLEITDVRVERLQDISEADAIAEGCTGFYSPAYVSMGEIVGPDGADPVDEFRKLWDYINAARGYGWGTNPWVWVVSFKRIDRRDNA